MSTSTTAERTEANVARGAAIAHHLHAWHGPGPVIRSLTSLTLRMGLSLVFLNAAFGKFQARLNGTYPGSLIEDFRDNWLGQNMPGAVRLFAEALPFVELGIGALLALGLFTTFAATLSGILLLHLLFGTLAQGDPARIPAMLTYLFVNAGVLWLSQVCCNYISLDGLIFGLILRAPEGEESIREVLRETRDHLAHRH